VGENESKNKEVDRFLPVPNNWILSDIHTISKEIYRYPTFYGMEHLLTGVPVIRGEHIRIDGSISHEWSNYWFISAELSQTYPRTILELDDIIMSVRGSVGKTGIIDEALQNSQLSPNCIKISVHKNNIFPKYVLFYSKSLIFQKMITELSNSTTIQTIKSSLFDQIVIPIPPLPEQRRIVTKIEELFTQLDAGIASLKKAQAKLKRYRQAVLKAAFEGRLTLEWREEHPNESSQFLKLIKERWETNHKGKKFSLIDTSELPKLPNGWNWLTFEQVSQRVVVGHVGPIKHEYIETGIPFLRSQNVRENHFDPNGLKFISSEFHKKLKKSMLLPNDVLIIRSGSIGISCVLPESIKEANCCDLTVVKQPYGILPKLAAYYMNSIAQRRVHAQKVGVALIHFNTKVLAAMPIPVPPIEEQKIILFEIERYLSIVEKLENSVERSLRQSESLRQSILKRAFEGKLVPQDPKDEPASVLLERIRAEKALHQTKTKSPKTPKRKIKNGN